MEDIVIYRETDGIAWIIMNRPDHLNALNREMLERLSALLDDLRTKETVKVAVLSGSGGRAFSAGADIQFLSRATPSQVREMALLAVSVGKKIETLGKVVIAAINGYALGGGLEMAEACSVRIASRNSKFGHPEVRIGAVAGWGGTARLSRLVGLGRAMELLVTGRTISAEEAEAIGLVSRIVDGDRLEDEARSLAEEIARCAGPALSLTAEAVRRGIDGTLDEALVIGADCFGRVAATDDFREGTTAFLQKRSPLFTGK